ncbi:MAG: hypothetical protein JRH20_22300 [Deltaproteobacteria bacterium]|nr:hypothetical protein [Deltaproteobacteria bacterium]
MGTQQETVIRGENEHASLTLVHLGSASASSAEVPLESIIVDYGLSTPGRRRRSNIEFELRVILAEGEFDPRTLDEIGAHRSDHSSLFVIGATSRASAEISADAVITLPQPGELHACVCAVRGMLDGLFMHGFIGYDYIDMRSVFSEGRRFVLGRGCAGRETTEAAERALGSLEEQGVRLGEVRNTQIGIRAGEAVTLCNVDEVVQHIARAIHPSSGLMFYACNDVALGERVGVSIFVEVEARVEGE